MSYVLTCLNKENEEARTSSDGHKYRLSSDDWKNVKRIKTEFSKQHRFSGIAYIYNDVFAVLNDGTTRHLVQVGPYKYNDRKWERNEDEKKKAHEACDYEAKLWKHDLTTFFRSLPAD